MSCKDESDKDGLTLGDLKRSIKFFKGDHRHVFVKVDGKIVPVKCYGIGETNGGTEDMFIFADKSDDFHE